MEVGWHLPREQRGNGYATEGARAALNYAFITPEVGRSRRDYGRE